MKKDYFGTDGIRGRVGEAPITAEFMLRLGQALGHVLNAGHAANDRRPAVVIDKDTRVSGYMFESALEAGLVSAGTNVQMLGPMPTPAVAWLVRELGASACCMGTARSEGGTDMYHPVRHLRRTSDRTSDRTFDRTSDRTFDRIVLDCAHGATYHVAPRLFADLGADVTTIGVRPDGFNINDGCGSTHLEALERTVREHRADLGIAFDGDGDRVLMIDAQGGVIDGDDIVYLLAKDLIAQGQLRGPVVGTLMTNYGVELALRKLGAPFLRANVGDNRCTSAAWCCGLRVPSRSCA